MVVKNSGMSDVLMTAVRKRRVNKTAKQTEKNGRQAASRVAFPIVTDLSIRLYIAGFWWQSQTSKFQKCLLPTHLAEVLYLTFVFR